MPERAACAVRLAGEADVAGFRQAARRLLAEGIGPACVAWQVAGRDAGDLFAGADAVAPVEGDAAPAVAASPVRVPAFFVPLCERATLHADPGRFALLYRLLWRLVREPALRGDPLDADRVAAETMARIVRREMHKMTAFVRFRPIGTAPGVESSAVPGVDGDDAVPSDEALATRFESAAAHGPTAAAAHPHASEPTSACLPGSTPPDDRAWHVAWFEPAHHVVEATAPFFVRRFAQIRWAILTPERCVRWDGATLAFGPGARRGDAPAADAGERLWLTYYEHIFNPARLKPAAMRKEMPRRYWPNLPEAALIPSLTARAAAQTDGMIGRGGTELARRRSRATSMPEAGGRGDLSRPTTLAALRDATQACRECPIGALATQSVPGEGAPRARLMLVGEQPGDQEDLRGHPFVGPAGQLLAKAMAELGWQRGAVFLTNAVRHFKYELRGTRRIHKTPSQREAAACLHWLENEIEIVAPRAAIALGATAARSLMGRPVGVTSERGRWLVRDDGLPVLVTLHPSALLRMDPAERDAAFERWLDDLRQASPHAEDESRPPGGAA